jgi:CRISPR-associated protein Cas2
MYAIVVYNVQTKNSQNRVRKILKDYGKAVQQAVFECNISDTQFNALKEKLGSIQLVQSESIRVYPLCQRCNKSVIIFGKDKILEEPLFYLV